jgi:hypothetical protein
VDEQDEQARPEARAAVQRSLDWQDDSAAEKADND